MNGGPRRFGPPAGAELPAAAEPPRKNRLSRTFRQNQAGSAEVPHPLQSPKQPGRTRGCRQNQAAVVEKLESNRVQREAEFKTPTRISRSKPAPAPGPESPLNDTDFQQDIIWDAASPSPHRLGKRGKKAPAGAVNISEIVSRIAPKHGRPRVAEPTLQQWIGDSAAIPCTPDVQAPRTKKKSPRRDGVLDLLRLAQQFDLNMFHEEEQNPEEPLTDDFLDKGPVPRNRQPNPAAGSDLQPDPDLQLEDDLDFLFDGPTQQMSGNLSQVLSPTRPASAALEVSGKPSMRGSDPAGSGTRNQHGPVHDAFEDDWENDDLLNDSLVLEMTQNPLSFMVPKISSTQKPADSARVTAGAAPGQNPLGRGAPGQNPLGRGAPDQNPLGRAGSGQNLLGRAAPGQNPLGRAGSGQNPQAWAAPGQNPLGRACSGQNPLGRACSGQNPLGRATPDQNHQAWAAPGQNPLGRAGSGQNPLGRTGPSVAARIEKENLKPRESFKLRGPDDPGNWVRTDGPMTQQVNCGSKDGEQNRLPSVSGPPTSCSAPRNRSDPRSSTSAATLGSDDLDSLFSSEPVWDDPADDHLLREMCDDLENRIQVETDATARQTLVLSNQRTALQATNRTCENRTRPDTPGLPDRAAGSSLADGVAARVKQPIRFSLQINTNGSERSGLSRPANTQRFTCKNPGNLVTMATGKCSAAEIELKKQQALERRRQRLQTVQNRPGNS